MKFRTFSKLNLYLRVFPIRDDGFHDIISLMQTIDIADEIEITEADHGISIECDNPSVPTDESNTIAIVYNLLKEMYPEKIRGANVVIKKNIPSEAGLAGGSGNGTGMLLGLNRMFSLGMDDEELLNCAASVGSDMPFFLSGGCALISGKGEIIEKLSGLVGMFYIVVIPPGEGVSSGQAYSLLDDHRLYEPLEDTDAKLAYTDIRNQWLMAIAENTVPGLLHNDFEKPIMDEMPEIASAYQKISTLGLPTLLTGSGSAIFALTADYQRALEAFGEITQNYGYKVFLAKPVPQGVEFID